MSVLIKDMEMPDSCIDCRFGKETNYLGDFEEKCLANNKCGYVSVRKPRLDSCPLTEIKEPHGRLIDADKLNIHYISPVDGFCVMGVTEEDIELADTIIEAEGET